MELVFELLQYLGEADFPNDVMALKFAHEKTGPLHKSQTWICIIFAD